MSYETLRVSIADELDAFFAQYTAAGQAKGLVYGFSDTRGLVHSAGFGVADEAGTVPDADTLFPIASMSKSFIACAALLARDRGVLSLEDPITKYIPEFRASAAPEDPCEPPSIGMLLAMRGGLTEDNSWVDPFIGMPERELLELVGKGVRYSNLPGTVFEYSNLGYTLAAIAVGRAVGNPITDFVRDEVIAPLGLASTCFDSAAPERRAVGYSLDAHGDWVPYPPNISDGFAGAGGIMSTVRDIAGWMTWLGAAFRPQSGKDRILGRAARRDMQRLHSIARPAVVLRPDGGLHAGLGGYGLGLSIEEDPRWGTVVSHGGGLPGFKLFMCWHPDSGHGVTVLTNSHRGDPAALCTEALQRILTREKAPARTVTLWPETERLRAEADRLVRDWDEELAARIFAENVDFDRPLAERRAEVAELIAEIGPLADAPAAVVSTSSPADVTWSIPGERGELLCMIHLTPVDPARIQEFEVRAVPAHRPRAAAPVDISPRRTRLGDAFIGPPRDILLRG
ncbi:serine hydrolase domain-containing protein [Sciscionella marina]|uniref:serine hydrolase domain-containing protein n=1 Tax=Sciscionella marina TaxID=508770 RepID=UPI0003633AFC|nr:serine hydrolase domain-containing protein [Sciscionella marina]